MHRLPATAVAIAAVATLGVGAGSAFAAGATSSTSGSAAATQPAKVPATLQQIKARAAAAIATRITDLHAAVAKVQAASDLGTDQAALQKTLQGDLTGLQALGQRIAADTTTTAAKADAMTIFTNYRVLALALPVTRLVVATDRIDATTLPRANRLESKLAGRITPANTAQLTPLLNDIKADLASAGTATSGISAHLLTLTPASWNSDHTVLEGPRAQVRSAVADLGKAVAAGKQARADLRADRGAAAPTSAATAPAA